MEIDNPERTQYIEIFQNWLQVAFADSWHREDKLKLCDFIYDIYVVHSLCIPKIPLMYGIHSEESGTFIRMWFLTLADGNRDRFGLIEVLPFPEVPGPFAEVVVMGRGDI